MLGLSGMARKARSQLRGTLKDFLRSRGLRIGDYGRLTEALFKANAHDNLAEQIGFLLHLQPDAAMRLLPYLPYTHSQAGQDLFVLSQIGAKREGYFVEFGATQGVNISNSYFFESHLGWNGIVAEPARMWHRELRRNRKCHVETRCVWSASGATLRFSEAAELSTVSDYVDSDFLAASRRGKESYEVRTISLNDLLEEYQAPRIIDYLSIDTEGSEFEILNAFDFERRTFAVITCEHNHTPQREKIHRLLTAAGYRRIMEAVSKADDWYVHPDALASLAPAS
jgi:FkbM family methyltransferase